MNRVACFVCLLLSLGWFGGASAASDGPKRVLLLSQKRDHPPQTHEYHSGVHVLRKCLESTPGLELTTHCADEPWPEGPDLIRQCDAIVLYLGEGGKWAQTDKKRWAAIQALAARGGGIVALHWAIGAKDDKYVPQYVNLLGGMHGGADRKYAFVETDVNVIAPQHPLMAGVELTRLKDEFYYRLKFAKQGTVTPLLSAMLDGQAETVAWAYERPDGGRSFGFSGMHYHDNWRLTACRRMAAQGVLWTLRLPVPERGLAVVVPDAAYTIRDHGP